MAADEKEGGVRATLNLGHTFGHAIENVAGYGEAACRPPTVHAEHSASDSGTSDELGDWNVQLAATVLPAVKCRTYGTAQSITTPMLLGIESKSAGSPLQPELWATVKTLTHWRLLVGRQVAPRGGGFGWHRHGRGPLPAAGLDRPGAI